ncbi:MAG: hypothetical protein V1816_14690 [Pseudomonadota bacterium]
MRPAMSLRFNDAPARKPWAAVGGGVKLFFAMSLFWAGLTSILVGIAYSQEKGAWAAFVTGTFMGLFGMALVWKGVHQVLKSLAPHFYEEEDA